MSLQADAGFEALYDVSLPAHPFPGLRPFREDEWPIFFGRERIIEQVIGNLVENKFVAVHGDSGSGKSSLVRAGVLPRLVHELGRGGATWRTASMEPGNAPMRNLAAAFAELDKDAGNEDTLTRFRRILNLGRDAAPALVKELRRNKQDHLCILVDQFEEIFAFARENRSTETELFIAVLTGIQQQRLDGLHVILTMRSEYLGNCARFAGLAETINDSQYLLPPMSRPALIRAIREPAFLYDGTVTMDLAERLIADTGTSQDQLPLLQHGLMLMQRRLLAEPSSDPPDSGTDGQPHWILSLEDYRKTGGVVDLLSDHADRILDSIEAKHTGSWSIVEKVFRALTDIDADGHAIRRRQTLRQLADIADVEPETLNSILAPLRQEGVSFLRPYGEDPLDGTDEINISHEALIRCWKRIADPEDGWLYQEFRDGLIWKSLLVATDAFAADGTAVLSPAVTGERTRWMQGRNAAWTDRYGSRFDDVEALLKASQRNILRQKIITFSLGIAGIAVVILGLVAFNIWLVARDQQAFTDQLEIKNTKLAAALLETEEQRNRADKALVEAKKAQAATEIALDKFVAEKRKLEEAERENNKLRSQLLAQKAADATANGDAGSGLAMALEVLQDKVKLPYVPEAESSAYAAIFKLHERSILKGHEGPVWTAAFSPDGTRVVTASEDGTARVWTADGSGEPVILKGHEDTVWTAAFSPDGTRVVTASDDSTARVWAADGSGEPIILKGHEGGVWTAAFSPDGTRVVTASEDGTARVWTLEPVRSPQRAGPSRISGGFKGKTEQVTRAIDKSAASEDTGLTAIAISPSGDRIIRTTAGGLVGTWRPNEGQKLVADLDLDSDYTFVVAAGFAGERPVAVLSPESPSLPFEFQIFDWRHPASDITIGAPDAVAFAPEMNRAAMFFSKTSHVELYDIADAPRLVARVQVRAEDNEKGSVQERAIQYQMAFHPDGEIVTGVSQNGDRMFSIDWTSMQVLPEPDDSRPYMFDAQVQRLQSARSLQSVLALHADRDSLTVVAIPFTRGIELVVGDLLSGEDFQTIRPGPNERLPSAVAFSADGRRIALVSEGRGVSLYSREKGGIIGRFAIPGKQAVAAAFSADGKALAATSSDGTIAYWPIFPTTEDLKAFAEDVAPRRLTEERLKDYLAPPKAAKQ